MLKLIIFISIFIIISLSVPKVSCSNGDRSPFYQHCVTKCSHINCTAAGQFKGDLAQDQDFWDWLLWWSCEDECRYDCMWRTVEVFESRNYEIPKFHGKWPFKRILGVQEPASTFASILNLITHCFVYKKIKKEFPMLHSPMALFWHFFCWVCMTTWIWSAIFHARDLPFTEFMDYACAFTMVLNLLIGAIVRLTRQRATMMGKLAILLLVLYHSDHVRYLYYGDIDYDYNMLTNICIGIVGSVLWLSWALHQYLLGRRYVLNLVAFIFLSAVTLSLELLEFPPVYGWDAHAMWHLHTSLLPLFFYRFMLDDLRFISGPKDSSKLP